MHQGQATVSIPADTAVILDAGVSQQGLVRKTVVPKETDDGEWKENQLTSRRFSSMKIKCVCRWREPFIPKRR